MRITISWNDRSMQLFVKRTRRSWRENQGQRRSARKKERRASHLGRCNLAWYCLMRFASSYCFVRRSHEVTQLHRHRCTDSSLSQRLTVSYYSLGHKSGCCRESVAAYRFWWIVRGIRGRFLNEREREGGKEWVRVSYFRYFSPRFRDISAFFAKVLSTWNVTIHGMSKNG